MNRAANKANSIVTISEVEYIIHEDYKMIDTERFLLTLLFYVRWWNDIFSARERERGREKQIQRRNHIITYCKKIIAYLIDSYFI